MRYPLAERFKAPQGEGLYSGTQMAFVRMVGCSVGQGICTACDTNFDKPYPELGGGMYTAEEVVAWAHPVRHMCITGGEPLDRDLRELIVAAHGAGMVVHVESSGTVDPSWWSHVALRDSRTWLTVSPKPGWLPQAVARADEIKVILGGLGDGPGWPSLIDALLWADEGRLVFIQPRNLVLDIDHAAMQEALAVVASYPQLRLSTQLHKYIRTR